ncbi:MAG TPA: cell envelope biogenesis protein TolA [Beijerinckiaceae bacterium]|nr:cell envelope biogenesis protein TolA [Beijerinckiaceae bacterium]
MAFSRKEPGIIVSSSVHGAVLLAALVSFSGAPKYTDAQEAIAVEVITDNDLSEIMKGEKTAKEVKPAPPRADKVDEIVQPTPKPVEHEAQIDIPTPPPPLRRLPDPGQDDTPPVPTPPQRQAALPPPEPEQAKPEPPTPPARPPEPKVEAKPEPPKPPDAEAIEPPKPPVRPKIEPPKKVEAPTPEPPKRPVPPKPQPVKTETKPEPKLQPDKIASLLSDQKAEDAKKPPARPRSGDENAPPQRRLNPGEISKLLSREEPGQRAATGREVSRTASLGSATANAARMSPAMWDQFLGFLKDKYDQCWDSKPPNSETLGYRPKITVRFTRDGMLEAAPRLLNPSNDPAKRSLADSALRAVNHPSCNPMRIPARFEPFYDQWKEMPLSFDPSD